MMDLAERRGAVAQSAASIAVIALVNCVDRLRDHDLDAANACVARILDSIYLSPHQCHQEHPGDGWRGMAGAPTGEEPV